MDEAGICGRSNEIKEIQDFISLRVSTKQSGILYLTGPPGTGKSMCVRYILDHIKDIPTLNINCLRAQSSKVILSKICTSVGLEKFTRFNESEMIDRLRKKFTGRTASAHLIVLDEMDELPKSKNVDLIKTIFSWPNQFGSKLILIGIANTVNLTSRYQTICSIIGKDNHHITKILFKPYTSKDLKAILNWYLENDENFEEGSLEPKVLDMISSKCARENGDIRNALNHLRGVIDDTVLCRNRKDEPQSLEIPDLLTPPATPPPNPCKEKTNLTALVSSVKKRKKTTHHKDDSFPFSHQVVLTCIYKLCTAKPGSSTDTKTSINLVTHVMQKLLSCKPNLDDYRAMLEHLEFQGFIQLKKGLRMNKIILKISDTELTNLVQRKDMILNLINNFD